MISPFKYGIAIKSLALLSLVMLFSNRLKAQDNTLFFVNPYLFNPSYAGIEGRPAIFLNYKRQWANIDGSPKIANLSLHTPLKNFLSFGVNVQNDKRGIFSTSTGLISGAYTVMLGDYKSLRFGVSAGAGMNALDLSELDPSDTDPALLQSSSSFMQGSAGVSFHLKNFHGGIALPHLFEPVYAKGGASTINPMQQVMIHAANRFYWARNKHMLEPHLNFRYRGSQPSQIEAALVYHMNSILWLGGSYKQEFGTSAFLGFHLNKSFGIGYSYTMGQNGPAQFNSPSHEFQLTLLLGKKRHDVPVYSAVDIEKEKKIHKPKHPSASSIIAANRNSGTKPQTTAKPTPPVTKPVVTQKPVETKPVEQKPTQEVAKTETKPVVTQPETPKTPVVAEKKEEKPKIIAMPDLGEMPHVHDTLHPAHSDEKERISRLEEHAENPTEHHEGDVDDHPHFERHEIVKRGTHQDELAIGDYVIAGVFRSKINAEHFADGLAQHGFNADYGHLTLKNLWYVYIAHADTLEKAKVERNKYRKMKMFRDAWLLTVHH